uniref:Complexin 4c n=1 Tax=Sinocyclocheilus anshuiensis TaxID=1608454 RepID=A0A671LMW9_9TELE
MAFLLQQIGKETAASKGMSREEKIARDKEFMRDKYRIPQSAQDEATVQMAGEDLDFPEELAKMVEEDKEQEEMNDSFLGKLQNMDVDFDSIKAKAQSTMTEVKQAEDKCVMM